MKIYVCIKHVPDSAASIRVIDENRIDERVTFIINPYDEHCLTEACRIRDLFESGEVIAVCLGKEGSTDVLRSAMAMGADRSVLVKTDRDHDAMETARALKAAIDQDGRPDIIFTGRESIDSNGMQTMFRLGVLFGYPALTNAVAVNIDKGVAGVVCEWEKGTRISYKVFLPCIIAAAKGLNKPRYPTVPDIIKSRKKEIKTVEFGKLAFERSSGTAETLKLTPVTEKRTPTRLEGSTEQIVEQMVSILKNKARVI